MSQRAIKAKTPMDWDCRVVMGEWGLRERASRATRGLRAVL